MTSIIKLEALSGVQDDGPLCYLLQVDEFHFLLDCGWDESFDPGYIDALKRRAPQIDAVLLSYADISHVGALPFLVGKCNLQCPIYATVPVFKMGQMFLYDWYLSHSNVEEFTHFNLDDVDTAFERVQQLKYSQQVSLKGRGHGLQISPLPAGHMIGGTIWKITKMGEEEIVYAVDFNHKKERHLNGCTLDAIGRANLLITDAFNAKYTQARRKQRDEELLTNILSTVRNGGDVLVSIDTAGRVLELAHLLDQLWHNADSGLITYSLVMLNSVAYNVVEFAKSQVEWMSEKVLKAFEEGRYNPFQFKHVQLCHSIVELNRVRSPKVVLASMPDMECGFSRELFLEWSSDPKNSIIVTSRSSTRTLGSKLIHMATGGPRVSRHLALEIKRKIRLEGAELEEFWRNKKEKDAAAARIRLEQQRRSSRKDTTGGAGESSDDSDVEVEMTPGGDIDGEGGEGGGGGDGAGPSTSSASATGGAHRDHHPYDISYKWELHQRSSFFKQSKKTYPMYPFVEEKIMWDDYGQVIRPEDYMVAESLVPNQGGSLRKIDLPHSNANDIDSQTPSAISGYTNAQIPSKCISSITKLEVLCQVAFIDFEGRSDGESVKLLISKVKPKQLIVVHGSTEGTQALAESVKAAGIAPGRIFTPRIGQIVDATTESHIYQVTLTDLLMSFVQFQPIRDAELAWVDARVNFQNARKTLSWDGQPKKEETADEEAAAQKMDTENNDGGIPGLDNLPFNAIPPHEAVFVNDPKLSDLKQILIQSGFQAEFSGGILYVNNKMAIRRNGAGQFQVEGCASQDYYRIRDIIYKQYAIV